MQVFGISLRCAALAAAAALGLWAAPSALAGFAVQPADGSTVTTPYPTFLVYVGDGETNPLVEVSSSPDHGDDGFTTLDDVCNPATPFGEAHKFTCRLYGPLGPGTYYWAYTYDAEACDAYGFCFPHATFSGPFRFTVGEPVAPADASLVSPDDGASVGTVPTLVTHAPAGSSLEVYASDSSERLDDGTPAGLTAFSCSGTADTDDDYTCRPSTRYDLSPGETYYWWSVVTVDGTRWLYGPRSVTVESRAGRSGRSSSPAGSGAAPHRIGDAGLLPRSAHFTGRSIKQTRLSAASYALTKLAGAPKMLAVACWSQSDWPGVSGDSGDSVYSTYGFYEASMPHWVQLAPATCRWLEKLLYHRPRVPTQRLAFAVDTVTHEMIHALGYTDEAETECYAMQVSVVMAEQLEIPAPYAIRLARLNLVNYPRHPPKYVNLAKCRDGGAWDLDPARPSLPWHEGR